MPQSKHKENILDLLAILRAENPSQYCTLIKMHLSFVTDLSTDQCDGSFDSSGVMNNGKWILSPLMKKFLRGNSSQQNSSKAILTYDVVNQVFHLMSFLKKDENITQEGLFRKTGSVTRQAELKTSLLAGQNINLESGFYSAHDCASVLKSFLSELPEPILQEGEYHVHCRIAELCRKKFTDEQESVAHTRQVKALSLVFLLLPAINYELLKELLMLLHQVTLFQEKNKMSSLNLGTMFAPHILCPRKMSPNELQYQSGSLSSTVAFIIENAPHLFQIPSDLAIDVREYFRTDGMERQLSKRSMEDAPTKTSMTFIDRELTAEANDKDVTEMALAELYAYVQSLPDSAKKKKLINKFNEVSGPGTPKYNQSFQKKDLKVKSIGDSIKKHLFTKSIKKSKQKHSLTNSLNFKRSKSDDYLSTSVFCSPVLRNPKSPKVKTKSLENLISPKISNFIRAVNSSALGENEANGSELACSDDYVVRPSSDECVDRSSLGDYVDRPASGEHVDHSVSDEYVDRPSSNEYAVHPTSGDYVDYPSSGECVDHLSSNEYVVHPSSDEYVDHSSSDAHVYSPSIATTSTPIVKNRNEILKDQYFDTPLRNKVLVSSHRLNPVALNSKKFHISHQNKREENEEENNMKRISSFSYQGCKNSPALCSSVYKKEEIISPISRALRNTVDHEKLMLTPRSRRPIIVNSTTSLSSVVIQEEEVTEKAQTFRSLLNLHNDDNEDVELKEISSLPKKNSRLGVKRESETLSPPTHDLSSSFEDFYKRLSAPTLEKLADNLKSPKLSRNSFACPNPNKSHNETLTSVFKDYLLSRSVLTENPVNSSKELLTHSNIDTSKLECISSKGDDSLQNDLYLENTTNYQLSKSLLFCLDGNNPLHLSSTPKRYSISHEKSSSIKKRKSVNKSDKTKDESTSHDSTETDVVQGNACNQSPTDSNKIQPTNLHTCTPNGRSSSLLKNKNGTPIPKREKENREGNSLNNILFETEF